MPKNARGYTPLTVTPEVLAACPKPVTQLWSQVTAAQAKITDARQSLVVLEREADQAPYVDQAAATAAVAAGKPVPPSTVVATHEALEVGRRTLTALIDHADDVEGNFEAALHAHRADLADGFHAQACRALDEALSALADAGDAVDRFVTAGAAWNWARSDDGGQPSTYAYWLPPVFGQNVTDLIDGCARAIDRAHPDNVIRAEADRLAEWQAAQGRATGDGLVGDYAGRKAAMTMVGE